MKMGISVLRAMLLAAAMLALPVQAEDETIENAGEVSWVSGGVGEDSRERLSALEAGFGFNLKVVFALQSGDYLSEVAVRVADGAGKNVLQTTVTGPILLVRLPAGRYDLHAVAGGRELKQKVSVSEGRLGRTVFRWPAE